MALLNQYNSLCAVGFLARFSYALARTPVLPLFALYLGAGPEAIGLVVGISTVTGIFFKLPRRRRLRPHRPQEDVAGGPGGLRGHSLHLPSGE